MYVYLLRYCPPTKLMYESAASDEMAFGHLGRSTIGMRKNSGELSRPNASSKSQDLTPRRGSLADLQLDLPCRGNTQSDALVACVGYVPFLFEIAACRRVTGQEGEYDKSVSSHICRLISHFLLGVWRVTVRA